MAARPRAASGFMDVAARQASVRTLLATSSFSATAVEEAVDLLFTKLGLPPQYFASSDDETIAGHVGSMLAARELAHAQGKRFFDVQLTSEGEASAFFAARSVVQTEPLAGGAVRRGADAGASPAILMERYIEARYLDLGDDATATAAATAGSSTGAPHSAPAAPAAGAAAGAGGGFAAFSQAAKEGVFSLSQPTTGHRRVGTSAAPSAAALGGHADGAAAIAGAAPWRLQCYRSKGVLADGAHLRLYFLQAPRFAPSPGSGSGSTAPASPSGKSGAAAAPLLDAEEVSPTLAALRTRLAGVLDASCLATTAEDLLAAYSTVIDEQANPDRLAPSIHVTPVTEIAAGEDADVAGAGAEGAVAAIQLVVCFKTGSSHSLFASLSSVYRSYGLYGISKYVEPTATGLTILAFRLRSLSSAAAARSRAALPVSGAASGTPTPLPTSFGAAGSSTDSGSNGVVRPLLLSAAGGTASTTVSASASSTDLAALAARPDGGNAAAAAAAAGGTAGAAGSAARALEERLADLRRDVGLQFVLPRTSVTPLLASGVLGSQEVAYAYAAWKFAYHFLPRWSAELTSLTSLLKGESVRTALGPRLGEALAAVSKLRKAVQGFSYTEVQILDALFRHPECVALCFADFARRLRPRGGRSAASAGAVPASATGAAPGAAATSEAGDLAPDAAMLAQLRRLLKSEEDIAIFASFLAFNAATLRTNFFSPAISALSFRLSPAVFLGADYREAMPYAVTMVVSAEARGFHVRFADVSRGGIRMIRSASPQAYAANVASLFDEAYGLARTQHNKNKDIVEGGAKGVILLSLAHQDRAPVAFRKYVDCLLDVVMPQRGDMVDRLGKPELLFFGPDEGTADYMDWAALHARARGYPVWKALTTGKGFSLGGVPHDRFAMTTRGVRAYVTGLQAKLHGAATGTVGGKPEGRRLTKAITGGPDGDLGSNEIKLANEAIVAVVDGSGVLADPDGIHAAELRRLADARLPVKHFDRALLGPRGYLVTVDAVDVVLPDGTAVPSGMAFRNHFHTYRGLTADEFVPCGGRPAAVSADNVDAFLYGDLAAVSGGAAGSTGSAGGAGASSSDGGAAGAAASGPLKPRFTFIVEGANLFFTQDARLKIEAAGIPVFKDSSANKGGVTSSSMEVLAAMALNDEEFAAHMCVPRVSAAGAASGAGAAGAAGSGAGAAGGHGHGSSDGPLGGDGLPIALPAFYRRYVGEVQAIIEANARAEFECLWREHGRTGTPFTLLSDQLSAKIVSLSTSIERSESLWANARLRSTILSSALPASLTELVGGYEALVARLPEHYLRALFGSALASRFVYAAGLGTSEFSFYEYLDTVKA